ncbi:MAG: response regulator [Clostridia bacterium]|nr:response regulator [Clostridia bacterium]
MKLLIVDDEPIIVRGLTQLVDYAALGYDQVLTATKSSEALALLRLEKPEAMLSDIAMPGLTGLELLRLIRDEGLPTQVIFISGYRSFEYAQEAVALGAKDYLLKPVHTEKLTEDLKAIAAAHRERLEHDRFQRHMQSLSGEQEALPSLDAIEKENMPFRLLVFHLAVDSEQNNLASGLMHFSALSKGEAYCTEHGGIAFLKDDYLCAIVHGPDEQACADAAQKLAKGCADMVEKALARPFNYVTDAALLHSTQEIPEAFQRCRAKLSMPHRDQQTEDSLIDKMKEYIAAHCGEELTLDAMSDIFAMNPTYFSSFFHQKTGVKYKDYLTRVRMTEAKRLLLQTDLKVYEISQRVGYSDVRYFSQTFTKATGVLPKDYRSKHRK